MRSRIPIKTPEEIELMREASRTTSLILDKVGSIIRAGITTEDINTFVHEMMLDLGATPATLNYKGYPKSVCTSPNDVVCHGIPSPFVILKDGDIINVDVTCIKGGYHGDSSRMYLVGGSGKCVPDAVELVRVARAALFEGIRAVGPGRHVGDIGEAIERYIRSLKKKYGIVYEYTGHGLGKEFHEPPTVIHCRQDRKTSELRPGMTFTVEPMINGGTAETQLSKIDGWTVRTADGSLSAQWEHTVLITESGVEILTWTEADREVVDGPFLRVAG